MLNIIGGTYHELCHDPHWDELYGSGFRAAFALSTTKTPISFFTYADENTKAYLEVLAESYDIKVLTTPIEESLQFVYQHPLSNPYFYPSTNKFENTAPINQTLDLAIVFGMIEGNAILNANRVVYDPQNPSCPKSYFENGSTANQLVLVLNLNEARIFTNENDLDRIADYLIYKENVLAAIIKCGPEGAYLIQREKEKYFIPAYHTDHVWPIGTGDIFTGYFGYQWLIKSATLEEAAVFASQATAHYTNNITLPIPANLDLTLKPFIRASQNVKTVYLAGPFFTMAQRWLINEFRNALLSFDINVFSPFHDVGLGVAEQVVEPDLKGLREADLILCLLDGLDSGTLFEAGYAKALNKPVIAFLENEKSSSLTMLEGTDCQIISDFSTCIYQIFWSLYK